jgi:hypothetical protein
VDGRKRQRRRQPLKAHVDQEQGSIGAGSIGCVSCVPSYGSFQSIDQRFPAASDLWRTNAKSNRRDILGGCSAFHLTSRRSITHSIFLRLALCFLTKAQCGPLRRKVSSLQQYGRCEISSSCGPHTKLSKTKKNTTRISCGTH